jgi:maltooligosyltrehalose synthase
LEVQGIKSSSLIVFSRQFQEETVIILVPRLIHSILDEKTFYKISETAWQETKIIIPENFSQKKWQDIFSGQKFNFSNGYISPGRVLDRFPVSVLFSKGFKT